MGKIFVSNFKPYVQITAALNVATADHVGDFQEQWEIKTPARLKGFVNQNKIPWSDEVQVHE